jgi:hypothetical protein
MRAMNKVKIQIEGLVIGRFRLWGNSVCDAEYVLLSD